MMLRRGRLTRALQVAACCLCCLIALPAPAVAEEQRHDPVLEAIASRRFSEARRLLEENPAGRAEGPRMELLTQVCNALDDHEAAIRFGKKAIAALPESGNAHYQYAVAIRIKMQSVGQIKAMFSLGAYKKALLTARELDPRNLDAREEEIGFLAQAPGIAGGDLDRARELAAELAELHPRRGLEMQIEVESTAGDPARATALYREALAVEDPKNARLRLLLGFHLQRQGQFREADQEFQILQEAADPLLATGALYQRARNRILGGYEPEQAIVLLKQFLARVSEDVPGQPTPAHAYWRMGNAQEQLNNIEQARADYTRALELDPDNDKARKDLKALPR